MEDDVGSGVLMVGVKLAFFFTFRLLGNASESLLKTILLACLPGLAGGLVGRKPGVESSIPGLLLMLKCDQCGNCAV